MSCASTPDTTSKSSVVVGAPPMNAATLPTTTIRSASSCSWEPFLGVITGWDSLVMEGTLPEELEFVKGLQMNAFKMILLGGLTLLFLVSPVAAETHLNFLLGGKTLDSDDWDPGSEQGEFALMTTFGSEKWPVQIALDALGTANSEDTFNLVTPGIDTRGRRLVHGTTEFDFGVRKIWEKGRMRPFVGGGFAVIGATQERLGPEATVLSDSDSGGGMWIDGGIFWRFAQYFNLGVEGRISAAEVTLFDEKVQAGGSHLGLILGFSF
jgi:hypothetical protein